MRGHSHPIVAGRSVSVAYCQGSAEKILFFFGVGATQKKRKIFSADLPALDNARNGLTFAAIVENHRQRFNKEWQRDLSRCRYFSSLRMQRKARGVSKGVFLVFNTPFDP